MDMDVEESSAGNAPVNPAELEARNAGQSLLVTEDGEVLSSPARFSEPRVIFEEPPLG